MYGLGVAERELARFIRTRRDEVVITTKFGIAATTVARALGRVQGPARRVLAAAPSLQQRARSNAADPSSGRAGALLYNATGYDPPAAKASLERSLRLLQTDHVDIFLLHDPHPGTVRSADVCALLEDARRAGLIRTWGVAGESDETFAVANSMPAPVPVIQTREDILDRSAASARSERVTITFGVLQRALPAVLHHLSQNPDRRGEWSQRVDADETDPDGIAMLLLREALAARPTGVVLYSSIHAERLGRAAAVAASSTSAVDPQLVALRELVARDLPQSMRGRT
jgi:hypothetical protein